MDVQPPLANGMTPPLGSFLLMLEWCCFLPAGETPNLPMEKSEFCFCLPGQHGFVELPRWQLLLLLCTERGVCVCSPQHSLTEASCPL